MPENYFCCAVPKMSTKWGADFEDLILKVRSKISWSVLLS